MSAVGIESIGVYPCALALPMEALCAARGAEPEHVRGEMLIDERSLNPPFEDPITMAVHAGMIALAGVDRSDVELLLVCSESGVDQEKAMSTWVHRYLDLPSRCRNLELKHACYSATAALGLAASWIRSGEAAGKKALVVASDQSRMHLGKPWEFVMGAGAAAFVVSDEPAFLELERGRGIYTEEVSDLTRPTSTVETGNSATSLLSYMHALQETYDDLQRSVGQLDYAEDFAFNIYHAPFGGLTRRAHRTLLRRAGVHDGEAALADFRRRSEPALRFNRRMGGTYAASTFVGLLGLAEHDEARAGDRLSIFSYGSGCCAELYRARFGRRFRALAERAALGGLVAARRQVTVAEYEALEATRTAQIDQGDFTPDLEALPGLFESHYAGRHRLLFRGCKGHVRQYAWSDA